LPLNAFEQSKGLVDCLTVRWPIAGLIETGCVVATAHIHEVTKKHSGVQTMTVSTILLIIVVLMLVGAVPNWPHSRGWGYGPSGALGTILLILVVLLLLGRI
jgi:uncharacterized membrane protein YoaK (UPF0700 family)